MTTHRRTDDALLARVAQQDVAALEELYDRYGKQAYSLAYRILGDSGAAEDAVQEAFVSIWRKASRFRSERGMARTWLFAIVHHRAIDRLRARRFREQDAQAVPASSSDAEDPSDAVWATLQGDAVRRAVGQLPLEQRRCIELAYFRGYTQAEIADLTDVPLGTVKGRLRLALHKLRDLLAGGALGVLP